MRLEKGPKEEGSRGGQGRLGEGLQEAGCRRRGVACRGRGGHARSPGRRGRRLQALKACTCSLGCFPAPPSLWVPLAIAGHLL